MRYYLIEVQSAEKGFADGFTNDEFEWYARELLRKLSGKSYRFELTTQWVEHHEAEYCLAVDYLKDCRDALGSYHMGLFVKQVFSSMGVDLTELKVSAIED